MEIKSLRESSLKKYKDSCHLIIVLSFFGALFAWGSRHDIGSFNAGLSVTIDLIIMILAIVTLKTKSKIFAIIIIVIMFVLVGLGLFSIVNGGSFTVGGLGIIILIVAFSLNTHLTNIHNPYDKYTVSFDIEKDEDWDKFKIDIFKQYISEGYKETRNDEKVLTLRKDDNQYVQLIRNKLKCNLSVVGTKKPTVSLKAS